MPRRLQKLALFHAAERRQRTAMQTRSATVRQHEADEVSGDRQPMSLSPLPNGRPLLFRRRDRKAYPFRRQPAAFPQVFGDSRAVPGTGFGTKSPLKPRAHSNDSLPGGIRTRWEMVPFHGAPQE